MKAPNELAAVKAPPPPPAGADAVPVNATGGSETAPAGAGPAAAGEGGGAGGEPGGGAGGGARSGAPVNESPSSATNVALADSAAAMTTRSSVNADPAPETGAVKDEAFARDAPLRLARLYTPNWKPVAVGPSSGDQVAPSAEPSSWKLRTFVLIPFVLGAERAVSVTVAGVNGTGLCSCRYATPTTPQLPHCDAGGSATSPNHTTPWSA